jgi:predicted MFS family arabinose efflux permease
MTVLGLFLKPMADEFGLSRTELSIGPSVMALVAAMCSPFIGGLIDRWGSRSVALIGVMLLPLGLFFHSMLGPNVAIYLGFALFMGLAAAIACPLPYISVLPQWFDRRLGLAISLAMSGVGFGQIVLPKLAAALIESGGWRLAWANLAAIILVVGLLNIAFLFRDNPDFQARRKVARSDEQAVPLAGIPLREAVRTPLFWLLALAVALVALVGVGTMIHIVPMLTDRGIPTAQAANAVAVLGAGSLIGRLLTGVALDRFNVSLVGGTFFSLQGVGMLALWSGADGMVPYVAVFLIGLAVGAETDIIPFAIRRKFGMLQFGKIFGSVYGIFSLGPVLGPLLMGLAFDRFESYWAILIVFAGCSFVAAAFVAICGRLTVEARPQAPALA